ncbi:hypothetical protein HYX70_05260 [Candidatus Saccharibacteria bacterium]|nr:hypothetical protein [Candidatus Saccharibacteria bacterium]
MKQHVLKFRASDKAEFQTITDGKKTVETRAATDRYKKFEVGDVLVIKCGGEQVEKTIKKIKIYSGVDELIESVGLPNVMPLVKDIEEAKRAWYSYPGYKEKIAEYGLVAWYI